VAAVNQNTVVVMVSSYPVAIGALHNHPHIKAILYSAHGGQEEGAAIADALFGDYAPAGRLNCTWYRSVDQLPPITDYDIIKGKRTYMYFEGTPLYPFGYGLTYTTFRYGNLKIRPGSVNADGRTVVSVTVGNTGKTASDEVVQLYVRKVRPGVSRPLKELKGFERIRLLPGAARRVRFELPATELAYWDESRNAFRIEPGCYEILIGSSSADIKLAGLLNVGGR
jgi:beta-glucosidase